MPNEISDAITSYATAPGQQAIAAINDNPDQAAKAVQLGGATGVPPSIVNGDIDHFQQNLKSSLASTIIGTNPELQSYIRNNPIGASVSNDDWGALGNLLKEGGGLDTFTKFMQDHDPVSRGGRGAIEGALSGAEEGFGSQPLGADTDQSAMKNWNPISRALANFELDTGELAARTGSAAFGATSGAAAGVAKGGLQALGASDNTAEGISRDISDMVQMHLLSGNVGGEITEFQGRQAEFKNATGYSLADAQKIQQDFIQKVKPWTDNGLVPPRGVSPQMDEILGKLNANGIQSLDQTFTAALDSATRERSPEMFERVLAEKYKNATVGISGDAVAALYGDKLPAPGDGLLGFVPDMANQLKLAQSTGTDVHIPISDFLANVDPKVYQGLHDDLRMFPNGITARELTEPPPPGIEVAPPQQPAEASGSAMPKELQASAEEEAPPLTITRGGEPPKLVIDSPLAMVRGTDGLEPMFSVGDRKISLAKQPDVAGFEEFHNYDMLDETGKRVGQVELLPDEAKKQLYVANVNGLGGLYSNSFGPGLVRDMLRQLKELYPGYETITGHRVTGARYDAGVWEDEVKSNPVVKLDTPNGWGSVEGDDSFRKIFESPTADRVSKNIYAENPTPEMLAKYDDVVRAVQEEMQRTIGGLAQVRPVGDMADVKSGIHPLGLYIPGRLRMDGGDLPSVLYNLFHPDAIGSARHEGVHVLRHAGFFTSDEWKTLTKTSMNEDWIGRYNIDSRYSDSPLWLQNEESIAEAYRDWAKNKDSAEAKLRGETPITQIFAKMQALWEAIKSRVAQIFGREPTYQELFQAINSGDIAKRMQDVSGERAIRGPLFQKEIEDQLNNVRAESMGLDAKSYAALQSQIKERYANDLEAAKARAEREQAKRQTAEWKSNRSDLRKEVSSTIRNRPDVAADLFLGSKELYGQVLEKGYRLSTDDLTSEQQAGLPKNYQAKNGLSTDGIAKMFGYQSGDELVNRLIAYNAAKVGEDGAKLSPQEMVKKTIDAETDRQMEAKYGNLGENIMHEAQDQAYSDHNINLIAEEYQAASMKAGITPIDKQSVIDQADEMFGKMSIGGIKIDRLIAQVGKHSRDVERGLIGGDQAGAMVSLQKKYLTTILVNRALKLNKEVTSFDKTAKRLGKADVKSIDPEYLNWIHEILPRVGKKVARAPWDVQKSIGATTNQTLAEFAQDKADMGRVMPVADELLDPKWAKEYNSLTADEFKAVKGTVDTIAANGRDERKINRAGEQADFEDKKAEMLAQFEGQPIKYNEGVKGERSMAGGLIPPEAARILRSIKAKTIQMETLLNAFDHFDKDGVFNQYVMRDLIQAASRKDADIKEFSKKLLETDDGVDLKKAIDQNIFHDPISGSLLPITRKELRVAILNSGNPSSMAKFAKGWKTTPEILKVWLDTKSTKEDWDWAQKVWGIWAGIKNRVDTTYRSMSKVEPSSVRMQPIDTPYGTYKGGYYPVIAHETFEAQKGKLAGEKTLLDPKNYVSAMPNASYIKERTGDARPMSLSLDAMPGRMMQEIHDYSMRPALVNAAKVFFDKDIRNAVTAHWGSEYRDQFTPYLQGIANSSIRASKGDQELTGLIGLLRNNMITTLIGLNPATVIKHGGTAFFTSLKEVGPGRLLNAYTDLLKIDESTGENNYQFAMENSLELQRRHQDPTETLYGATQTVLHPNKIQTMRQFVRTFASTPIALSDKFSAVPLWLAQYKKSMEENGGVHGDAVYDADRAVRRAHGSTSITNRTAIVRDTNPLFTSFYNFFSDIVNRQMETVWRAGEAQKLAKAGDKDGAFGQLKEVVAGAFVYTLIPALIEYAVSPPPASQTKNESWPVQAASGLLSYESAGWIGVRDVVSAIMNKGDPTLGIGGTELRVLVDAANDFKSALSSNRSANTAHDQKVIEHAGNLVGFLTGMMPSEVSRTAAFGYGVAKGTEHPKSAWDWLWTGPKYGTLKGHQ